MRFCVSVDFLPTKTLEGARECVPALDVFRRMRCFMCVRAGAGCPPSPGECVVAVHKASGKDAPSAVVVGAVCGVQTWCRSKNRRELTTVRGPATIADIERLMALAPVSRDVGCRVVVGTSVDDVRNQPYVTGRMWAGAIRSAHPDSPFHPSKGVPVFVELTSEVPTANAEQRKTCLAHVRDTVARLMAHGSTGPKCVFFVAQPSTPTSDGGGLAAV